MIDVRGYLGFHWDREEGESREGLNDRERIFIREKECLGEKNVWNGWLSRQNSGWYRWKGEEKKKAGEMIFIVERPWTHLNPCAYECLYHMNNDLFL